LATFGERKAGMVGPRWIFLIPNDSLKLQEVFGLKDINELPIVYNIAWYEQKAVIVLLALLSLALLLFHFQAL